MPIRKRARLSVPHLQNGRNVTFGFRACSRDSKRKPWVCCGRRLNVVVLIVFIRRNKSVLSENMYEHDYGEAGETKTACWCSAPLGRDMGPTVELVSRSVV